MRKLVLMLLVMLIPATLFAAGYTSNVYTRWFNLTGTAQTVAVPFGSRNIWIRNGSGTVSICVGVSSAAILNDSCNGQIILDPDSEISLYDYVTESVKMAAIGGTAASPVSVVITY